MRGAYLLLIKVKRKAKVRVGKLGSIVFESGWYAYVGSAFGKSLNLLSRVERHFKRRKKLRWHVDFLLAHGLVSLEGAILLPSKKRIECKISKLLEKRAEKGVEGFGCSDCRCKAHLYYFKSKQKLLSTLRNLDFQKLNPKN